MNPSASGCSSSTVIGPIHTAAMPASRSAPFGQLPHDLLQRVAALLGDEDRWGRPGLGLDEPQPTAQPQQDRQEQQPRRRVTRHPALEARPAGPTGAHRRHVPCGGTGRRPSQLPTWNSACCFCTRNDCSPVFMQSALPSAEPCLSMRMRTG